MVTVSDVEALSSTGWTQLSSSKKTALLDTAESIVNGQLSVDQATFSTIEGDPEEAKKWLAAHFYELAEGGEAQSESTQGGNVSFNTVTGEWMSSLSETRYGRTLDDLYLRNRGGLAIVTTR
jgi:hypothetical protein